MTVRFGSAAEPPRTPRVGSAAKPPRQLGPGLGSGLGLGPGLWLRFGHELLGIIKITILKGDSV